MGEAAASVAAAKIVMAAVPEGVCAAASPSTSLVALVQSRPRPLPPQGTTGRTAAFEGEENTEDGVRGSSATPSRRGGRSVGDGDSAVAVDREKMLGAAGSARVKPSSKAADGAGS